LPSIATVAIWLFEPSSPWIAIFKNASDEASILCTECNLAFILGNLHQEGRG
jgi:hypothetical protein